MNPSPGQWLARPLRARKTLFDLCWIWSASIYGLMFLHGRYAESHGFLLNLLLIVWGVSFVTAILFLPLRELVKRRRSRKDHAFADGVLRAQEFAVEIVVKRRGKVIGADRGVVWFDQGALGFSGERTSFLLAYEDLKPQGNIISEIDRPFRPLELQLDEGKAEVAIRPMWGQGRGYRQKLRRFLREKAAVREARQWPPITAYVPEADRPLSDRLEDAIPLEDDVDRGTLRVR